MTQLPESTVQELARWREECRTRPGALPAACRPVQVRLVRAVGRGSLPGIGEAFVKVMSFPRRRDLLRYACRELPAAHEARALAELARRAPDVPCPRVLDVVADRSLGLPRLSVLVTEALPVAEGVQPELPDLAAVAARLAAVGLFHGDLNAGNFVPLTDGRFAVLDLQSARLRRAPLGAAPRRAMAAKLLLDFGASADAEALVVAGLVTASALPAVLASTRRLEFEHLRRRVVRCLVESTEFHVRLGWRGVAVRRRAAPPDLVRVPVGRQARRLWLGDRVAEVLEGRPPVLAGAFLKWWWFPGQGAAYISAEDGRRYLDDFAGELLASADRWERIRRAGTCEGSHVSASR